jgi:hypothetical protein
MLLIECLGGLYDGRRRLVPGVNSAVEINWNTAAILDGVIDDLR